MIEPSEKQKLKQILESRLEEILQNIDLSNHNIDELFKMNLNDASDIVSANLQNNLNSLIIQKNDREIRDIIKALKKITKNTYGICEMCDEIINIERLKIKPHAKFCIKCREIYEREKKGKERK
ncbi:MULTISPECIES: RNA polymerase-binding protein DksA [unclassified Helicobacter]|uniref:RNA polymerase-binding protein DksA n=1 Tax=unclassified Helicobacter TaxID=2593540 RepID=UPI000CF12A8B|nr:MULTISPECIES: RNA polymerase-binding protein DksA [unclassified Helicobacter]